MYSSPISLTSSGRIFRYL